MRTLLWYIYFWLYLLCTLPLYVIASRKAKKNKGVDLYADKVASKWARSMVKAAGGKVTVVGQENIPKDGPIVFVSNHQSNFDIPLLLGYIETKKGFIAKAETKKIPIVGGWMTYMQCVFMDRSNPRAALKAIKEGIAIVKSGHPLVIFPEGTRSADGSVGEFKAGSFKLAMKAEAMIVPVTISGSYDMMRKGQKTIHAAKVTLTISEPMKSTGYESTESYLLREKVQEVIVSKL